MGRLRSYILRRLLQAIFVLLGLSMLIFVISRMVPGDPARMALGPRTPEWAVENLRRQLNLDKPLPVQYGLWLSKVVRGDLGACPRLRAVDSKHHHSSLGCKGQILQPQVL